MLKRVIFCLIISSIILPYTGCDNGEDPPYYRVLPVPYFAVQTPGAGYCAVACIQMWGHYDKKYYSQDEIAIYVGIPTLPDDAVDGVNRFTNSDGWIEWEPDTKRGQELTIAYSIACVFDGCPSIVPFDGGTHAVLAIGYKYHRNTMDIPIADFLTYHDPDVGGNLEMTGAELYGIRFLPVQSRYYVIVGARRHVTMGANGLAEFKAAGGTYYGEDPDDPFVPLQ
jgi:hypothetical protein